MPKKQTRLRAPTAYTVFYPTCHNKPAQLHAVDLPEQPTFEQIKNIVQPYFPGAHFEHVKAWWPELVGGVVTRENHTAAQVSMFVDEEGRLKRLQYNEAAHKIYATATMINHPHTTLYDVEPIVGVAIVFHRNVWN